MGWAGGSSHAETLILACKKNGVDEDARREIYRDMIALWTAEDWDTQNEVEGLDVIFDEEITKYYNEKFNMNPFTGEEVLSIVEEEAQRVSKEG